MIKERKPKVTIRGTYYGDRTLPSLNDYLAEIGKNPKDIYEFSTHVLIGKVEDYDLNGLYDRTSYHVSVEENLKGKAQDKIVVVAFKDSLKIGESYLFLLTGYIAPENFTYTLAGVNAVFPPDYEIR